MFIPAVIRKPAKSKKEFPPDVDTYWFHHRCYIAKATNNFLMPSRTGIEFVDPDQEHWDIHHWVRGGCLYGVMPCNGLTYAPPHNCACYPEAKLFGFNALAPASATRPVPTEVPDEGRLEKGPAFDALAWPATRKQSSRRLADLSSRPESQRQGIGAGRRRRLKRNGRRIWVAG